MPGTEGVAALGLDPDRAIEAGRAAVASGRAASVVVHTAAKGDAFRSLVRATGDPAALAAVLTGAAGVGLYRTATRDCRRHRVRWGLGEPTPGIGTIYGVARASRMTAAEFHEHWATTHRPLALRHHVGMWDYRQVSVVEPLTDASPDYDGFAIVQFPNRADMATRFFDGDDGKRVIRADAARFTDAHRSDMVLMREHVLLDAPLPAEPVWLTDYRLADVAASAEQLWELIGRLEPGEQDRESRRPTGIAEYRCRYEVRETGTDTCRLDWQPTALVDGASGDAFDEVVDAEWLRISAALTSALGPTVGG